jgi:mitochondrial fission protein ELM1
MASSNSIKCWIITEGIAGTENQCIGVTEALGIDPEIYRISLKQPWKLLSPYLGFESKWIFNPGFPSSYPDLLICSGRKSIAASRYIKKASGGKTFTVQIQDPRVRLNDFDLIALAEHDPSRAKNIVLTTAAPNRISKDKLAKAKEQFADTLSALPSPRAAILIGGNSKAYTLNEQIMRTLCRQLKELDNQGVGLMVTASRRTGEKNFKILKETLEDTNAYLWDEEGDNPYFGFLAWADYIIVTSDSTSMLSDAGTTGKPVYMISLEGGSKRASKLHKNLIKKGIMRPFEGKLEKWTYSPLEDSTLVANAIKEHMNIKAFTEEL